MSDVDANVHINIDSSSALVNLKRLESEINQFQRTVASSNATSAANQQALNRALLDGIKNTSMFDAKIVSAHDGISRFNDQLDRGKFSLGQYTRLTASQLPGMSRVFKKEFETIQQVAESRVKKINTQYIALGKTVDGVTKAIAATPTGLGKGYSTDLAMAAQRQQLFNKMIDDGSTKLLNWGKNTQWAGRQLMVGFSIPLAALGTVAAKTFMEIDKATVSLKRVYGDLSTTTKEVDSNVNALKALGAEYTKYGIALQETINIGARAAATGATNENLVAATEQTMRLATLGQIDYNQALDATISLQSAFGISSKDLGENIDYLNAVENQTILTLDDMTLAVPRVATVIKGLGGDVKDLAVFMTAMREGGVSAENAANALKSGLASLINPTKAARETLGGLGINIDAIVKANKGDLMGTIKAFGQALNSLSAFERQQALEKTFGKYQYARMGALFSNITKESSQAARAMDIAKMSAEELAAVANKELSVVSESTSVKFQAAMEKLKISIAPLGEAFLKGLTPVIDMVTKVADAFNNLPDGVKNAIAVITVAVAGIGPVLLMSIGLIGNGLANIVKGIQFFRKTLAGIKGDSSAFQHLTTSELEANAATNSLNTSANNLTGTLSLQRQAVMALTAEYERFASVAGIANGAMRGGGGGGRGGSTRAPVRRATGGTIPGSGNTDTVPAMLTPGEFVINKKATKENLPLLHAINDGNFTQQTMGFNKGGKIPGVQYFGTRNPNRVVKKPVPEPVPESVLEKAHFSNGVMYARTSDKLVSVTSQSERAQVLKELAKRGVPVIKLTDDWASISKSINQAARRNPTEKLTIQQVINALRDDASLIKVGPAMQRAGISDKEFSKKMIEQLRSQIKEGNLSSKTIITDKIFSQARKDAFKDFNIKPEVTGLRAPSTVDLNKWALRRIRDRRETPDKDKWVNIENELERLGIKYESGGSSRKRKLILPDGRSVSSGESTGFNKGGQIPGGKVTQSRPFYGAFNAKTIEMFKNWIGTHSESIPALRETILKDPKMKSVFSEGFSKSKKSETLLRSQFMSSIPEIGSEMSLGALKSFSAEGTDVMRHLADSRIRKDAETASSQLISDKKTLEKNAYVRKQIEENSGSLPSYAPQHKYRSPVGGKTGLDAWIEDTNLNEKSIQENIRKNEEIIKRYEELHPTVIRLNTPAGTVRANLDDIVPALEQAYGSTGKSYQVGEKERILHNARIKVTGRSTDKDGVIILDAELMQSVGLNKGGAIFASNGTMVPGVGNTDTVPAMLTPGEFVINKEATRQNLPLLRAINGGNVRGYNDGDIVQSSVVGYKAPRQIAKQTEQMNWATRAKENDAATQAAKRWGLTIDQLTNGLKKVAAHIVPDTGINKVWNPKNLIADTQVVNEMMNRTQKIAPSILENTKLLERISKSTGLSLKRVQRELENFAKGQHPITEKSALVLKRVASMDAAASRIALSQAPSGQNPSKVRNAFGARAQTGYFSSMTRAILGERIGTGFYKSRPRYTGPIIQTQRPRAGSRTVVPRAMAESSANQNIVPIISDMFEGYDYEQNKKPSSQSRYSSTTLQAREVMLQKGLTGNEGRKKALDIVRKRNKLAGGAKKFGGGVGKFGSALGVASMLPFMMQDDQGQFMGMNANALGMGAMLGGPMLQMAAPRIGGMLAGGLGAGGAAGGGALAAAGGAFAAAAPILLPVAAAAAAAGIGLTLWRKNIDENARETAKLTANLGVTANSVSEMGKILGKSTPQQRQAMQQLGLTKQQKEIAQETVVPQLQSEGGQKFLAELKTMKPDQQQQKIEDYLKSAVATRMMSKDEATVFAKAVGIELGNVMMGMQASNSIMFQKEGSTGMFDIAQKRMDALQSNPLIKQAMGASGATDSMTSAAAAAAVGGSMQVFSDLANTVALANEEYTSGKISLEKYNEVIDKSRVAQERYRDLYIKANTGSMEQGGTRQAIADQLIASGKMTQDQYDSYSHGMDIGRSSFFGMDTAFITQSIENQAAQDPALAAAIKGTRKSKNPRVGTQTEEDKKVVEDARVRAEKAQSDYVQAVENGMQAQFDFAILNNEMTVEQAINFQEYLKSGTKNAASAIETIKLTGDIALANFQAAAKEQGKSDAYIRAGAAFKKQGGNLGDYQIFIASFAEDIQDTMVKFFKNVGGNLQKTMIAEQKQLSAILGQENTAKIQSSATYEKALKEGTSGVFKSEAAKAEKAGVANAYGTIAAAITSTDNGEPMNSKEFLKRSRQTLKALKDFEKGGKEVKKRAVISLLTQVEGQDGKRITPEEAKAAYDDLIKQYGEKKILNLPTDVITKVTVLQDKIIGIDEAIANIDKLISAESAGSNGVVTGAMKNLLMRRAALASLRGAASSQISDLVNNYGTGNLPPVTQSDGGGGGGGAKSFMQSLLEQIQMYVDATATMKDLNNAKKDFIAETLKGKGIMDKLMGAGALGLNPQLMEYVMGLGPKGAKEWMSKNTRINKKGKTVLNKRGQNISDKVLQANIGRTMDESQYASQNIGMQMRVAKTLNKYGVKSEVMNRIAGDPNKAAEFLKIQRDVDAGRKGSVKEMMKFIKLQETQIDKEKDLAESMDPIGAEIKKQTEAHDLFTRAIELMKRPLQEQIDLYNKQLDQLQRLNEADQHRIDGLERQKEMIQRGIDSLSRQNEMDQRRADSLRREDEIRNRISDALSHDLDILSQQEQAIRDGYQKRIDALNKVSEINQHIIEQQRQQLGLSQALSQGDIYAAAGQVIDARQSNAAFASQQQQSALQQGQENAVAGLRTAGGLTREQAEKQIANIKEQSYQTGLKIRDIEDSIYDRNLEIIKLKDQQYSIDVDQILPIRDAIYDREQKIYDIQSSQIRPLQDMIEKIDEMKEKEDQKFSDQIASLEASQLSKEMTDAHAKSVNNLAAQYKGVAQLVAEINTLISGHGPESVVAIPSMTVGESPQDYADRLAKFKEEQAARKKAAEDAAAKKKKFAGGMIHAAAGMMVPGTGGMDSVPILAAPGEFIMRKAAVSKYGPAMMQAMNMGSYQLPKYNMPESRGASISPTRKSIEVNNSPVYNGYNVNVNVAGTNASANEIANMTISRIKEMKNVNIRSARG